MTKIKIDWTVYDKYNALGLSIPAIAKIIGVSKATLYSKVKERVVA